MASVSSLREILDTADEVQALIEKLSPDDRRALGGVPGTPYCKDDELQDIVKRFCARNEAGHLIGFTDLYFVGDDVASIVIAVDPNARRCGIATSLINDMVTWIKNTAGQEHNFERINWFARRTNNGSVRLALTAGFIEREDYKKDSEWWGGQLIVTGEENVMETNVNDDDMKRIEIDHADIVTSHLCNKHCRFCIDAFLNSSHDFVSIELVEKFLSMLDEYTGGQRLTVLLLGGEPTVLPKDKLIEIADAIHARGHKASMSTNGIRRDTIYDIAPYFDSIQITFDELDKMKHWRGIEHKINAKICGDSGFTLDKLRRFKRDAADFQRRSVSMYFTDDFQELCRDKEVWAYLDTLDWKRNGSYMYAMDDGVRFKKCIPGETNIIDEPTIPKLYPNGNYNKTWRHEELDDYLSVDNKRWAER